MKIFFAIVLIFLSACMQNKELPKEKLSFELINKKISKEAKIFEVEKTLGEGITVISDDGKNRMENILLACQSITKSQLMSGEEFSFNRKTGKRNISRGYKEAPVIINGEKDYGIGGGVCQVSTTLYLAALDAGFNITEHHFHSREVPYAKNHTDATVVYGEKDLKFVNNTKDTVYIYTWVSDNKIFSKIIKKGIDIQIK